jgi:hypothetical protein
MKLSEDPQAKCFMAGVPRITYTPGPFQIFQSAGMVIIVYQDSAQRTHIPTSAIPRWTAPISGWDPRAATGTQDTPVVDSVSF